jgi:endonuclease III related protein
VRSAFASVGRALLNTNVPIDRTTLALRRAYPLMRERFGHQHWWPGDTPFEVCVGAILVQNTSWSNVERAIANLKSARVLSARKLFALPEANLAGLIRPAGYFNVKARRLRSFLHVLVEEFAGDLGRLFTGDTAAVRERLLAINGIGPETADSLLLYAGGHHSFVIDAYTKRIFERHGFGGTGVSPVCFGAHGRDARATTAVQGAVRAASNVGGDYASLKRLCEAALNQKRGAARLDYWQDYHAQLVMVGKHFCRPRDPRCEACPLKPLLSKRNA